MTALEDRRSHVYGSAIIFKNNGVKLCIQLESSGLFSFNIAFLLFMISWIRQQIQFDSLVNISRPVGLVLFDCVDYISERFLKIMCCGLMWFLLTSTAEALSGFQQWRGRDSLLLQIQSLKYRWRVNIHK